MKIQNAFDGDVVTVWLLLPMIPRRAWKFPQRGFFCDDQSIRYPIQQSSISSTTVGAIGIALPLLTVSNNHQQAAKKVAAQHFIFNSTELILFCVFFQS